MFRRPPAGGVPALLAAVLGVLGVGVPAATAQELSWSSALDASGDAVYLLFTEPSLRFGRDGGLQPVISLGAYYVRVAGGNGVGLTPAVALRYGRSWGSVQGKVGWGRSSTTAVSTGTPTMMSMSRLGVPTTLLGVPTTLMIGVPVDVVAGAVGDDVFGGDEGGLNTSLQAELQGAGEWGLQGIASYSWEADVLWSRGRITRLVSVGASGSSVALGAELVWQVQTDDGDLVDGNEHHATYLGPVVRVAGAGGTVWAVSGGFKRLQPTDENTWYAKLELTIDP